MNNEKIIIMGFPRSGTSFLAKFFMEMGFKMDLKWNLWDDVLNAGYENKKVSFINNLLAYSYEEVVNANYMDVVKDYISQIDDEVIKYPRFVFENRILKIWLELFPKSKVIMTYRKPEDVLRSKRLHMGEFPFDEKQLNDFWNESFSFLKENGVSFCYLTFPELLGMYDDVFKVLNQIEIVFDYKYGLAVWNSIVDYTKVHFGNEK